MNYFRGSAVFLDWAAAVHINRNRCIVECGSNRQVGTCVQCCCHLLLAVFIEMFPQVIRAVFILSFDLNFVELFSILTAFSASSVL